jgi:hypothetical protein
MGFSFPGMVEWMILGGLVFVVAAVVLVIAMKRRPPE